MIHVGRTVPHNPTQALLENSRLPLSFSLLEAPPMLLTVDCLLCSWKIK